MTLMKSFMRGVRSMFAADARRRKQKAYASQANQSESLEQRQLLVVGSTMVPPVVQPGNGLDGVVHLTDNVPGGLSRGSGVLLDDGMHMLTAAHVVDGFVGDFTATFRVPDGEGGITTVQMNVPAANQFTHPSFSSFGSDRNDIAVIRLPEIAPAGATRHSLFAGNNEMGQTITVAGYGVSGDADDPDSEPSGQLRSGLNHVSVLSPLANEFRLDFDGNGVDTYGDGVSHGNNEALPTFGDSGGPAFINNDIAGIVARGSATRTYGATEAFTRVSRYQDFIRQQQTNGRFEVTLDMNNQPAGNDGTADEILVRGVGNDLQILVNGDMVFETSGVVFGSHDMSLNGNIGDVVITGSADGETVTYDLRNSDLSSHAPFLRADGPVAGVFSMNLGAGSQQLQLSSWTNYFDRHDVNGDGSVTAIDALVVINRLNQQSGGSSLLPAVPWDNSAFYDTNEDGNVTALDALLVINRLNSNSNGGAEGEYVPPPESIALGTTDFEVRNSQYIDGKTYYEFVAANSGTLTAESISSLAGNVDLKLYKGYGATLVASSTAWVTPNERIDFPVTAGELFVLEVSGINSAVDVRITNLVQTSGSAVTIHGTSSSDTLTLSTAGSNYTANINGTTYSWPGSSVSSIAHPAGSGYDSVTINASSSRDYAYLYTTTFTINGVGYSLTGSDIESKTVNSGGGNDYAYLYDSTSSDYVVSVGNSYTYMSGGGSWNRVNGFYSARAYSNSGGYDRQYFYDTAGNDTYIAASTYGYMYGSGYFNYSSGFDALYGYSFYGGVDTAYFYDSPGNDTFYANSTSSQMTGSGYMTYQYGFDNVRLYGYGGGTNLLDINNPSYLFYYYGTWGLI